jgi:catalase
VDVLATNPDAVRFVREAFKHYKAIATSDEATTFLVTALRDVTDPTKAPGVVTGADAHNVADAFVEALARHRHWDRTSADAVPV